MVEQRVLAHRCHRAAREYRCDVCDHLIFPGDYYEVTVRVQKVGTRKYLLIRKEHQNPICPYPDGDFDIDRVVSVFTEEFRLAA